MHLVSNAFRTAISNGPDFLSMEKIDWYEQISLWNWIEED
jgi:hypothetical protein